MPCWVTFWTAFCSVVLNSDVYNTDADDWCSRLSGGILLLVTGHNCDKCKKRLQFIHTVNGDKSKTATIKKANINRNNIAWMSMLLWLILLFYEFCDFWSVTINIVYNMRFLTLLLHYYYIFALTLWHCWLASELQQIYPTIPA